MVSELTVEQFKAAMNVVLILVVVEDGLRDVVIGIMRYCGTRVLILVVVEDGLRGGQYIYSDTLLCLNPCCCGRWSQRNISSVY